MPDVEHNVFCNVEVADAPSQRINNVPSTMCVSMRREIRSILSSSGNIVLPVQCCPNVFMLGRTVRDTLKNNCPGDSATRSFLGAFDAGGCSLAGETCCEQANSLTLPLRLAQPKGGLKVQTERNERAKPIWGRN
jgi:hypothetical protein